jgi:hypothetical protein
MDRVYASIAYDMHGDIVNSRWAVYMLLDYHD